MPDLLERLRAALADRYAIESEIGRGGMAVVFLAEDLKHHRQVALKVLHPELTATLGADRFLQEIEIVAGLQHPHILPLYDSGEADGLLYYVMPYAEGESLRQRLDREKQLAVDESVRIAVEVADGLDYAHRKGVVHRDIKPGNILLSEKHAVIADFGIARAIEAARAERVTRTGLGVGTPLYASPEQATAEETLDGRTDIYSLGCMLYEMLAGEPPLTGATPQMTHARRISETPTQLHTLRDTVPPALDHVIGRALAKIPADRYATASQFGQALQAALFAATPAAHADLSMTPGPMATTPTAPITPAPEPKRRMPRWLFLAVPTVAAAVVAALIFWQRLGSGASDSTALDAANEATAVQLTRDGRVRWAVISPDGSHLVVATAERGGGFRIAVSEIGAAQPERTLAVIDELWRGLSWLPDGSGVIFSGYYMGELGLYSVASTGGTVELMGWGAPKVSPDGSECLSLSSHWKHIDIDTLCGNRGETQWPEGVDSIPVAGTYERIEDAAYSPRGDYLSVSTYGSGTGSIRSVSRSGDDQRLMVEGGERITSLHWRDDGRVLYYVRDLPSGSELMRLATSPTGEPTGVPEPLLQLGDSLVVGSISSDSRRLTLVKTLAESRIVRLWSDESGGLTVEPVAGTEGGQVFWVSPDGEWLAFLVGGTFGADLYKVPIEGGTPERLTSSGNVRDFSWSPDSKMLAFTAPWRDTLKVWLISAASGAAMRLQGSVTNFDVEWASGPLMYEMPGGQNYWVVDSLRIRSGDGSVPLTPANLDVDYYDEDGENDGIVEGVSRPLVTNASVGVYMNLPRTSPDGRWVAVLWWRDDFFEYSGLWRLSLTDSTQVLVRANTRTTRYEPDGWTADGSSIYTKVGNDILFIPMDGGEPEIALTLPEEPDYACDPLVEGSETSWICWEGLSESDAWLIENFDPHVN
jgi:Tol biopolymer transport system component